MTLPITPHQSLQFLKTSFHTKLPNPLDEHNLEFVINYYFSFTITEYFLLNKTSEDTRQTFVLMKTSWRPLGDVFVFIIRRRLQDVFRTSWSKRIYSPNSYVFRRRLQDVLIKTNIIALVIRLEDVLKTFSRRLQDIFKKSSRRLAKISSRSFQNVSSS